jgi:hypothetical protein
VTFRRSNDWILQFDRLAAEKEEIHCAGRSARVGAEGRALRRLLLFPIEKEEAGFVRNLDKVRLPLNQLKCPDHKVTKLDHVMRSAVAGCCKGGVEGVFDGRRKLRAEGLF